MTSFTALRLHQSRTHTQPDCRIETINLDDLSKGDVVIRVAYSSLNYKDALAYAGRGKIVSDYPRVTGIDFTGYIETSSNEMFKPGDKVIVHGFGVGVNHDGGHAQYARVPANWVMHLPHGMDLLDACSLGAAGYTAGLALHWMEQCGLTPQKGEVAVTGASGGVASLAIAMLTHRGYRVCAITSKTDMADYLNDLGAERVELTPDFTENRPLRSAQWAGAIDSVGGDMLAWLLSTAQAEGVITAFGNAGGFQLPTTVYPFILRGVKLLGINANSPMPLRQQVWQRLHSDYLPPRLQTIRRVISLTDLPRAMEAMLCRKTHGRTIIDMTL
ncbi:acrylyl-CoA reductase family protein [Alcaligenes endophyticus]|uniref:Acryloyl-CoA reductase n=1 Tax=Alcaligenes endophyticus TaxID=1929088 RepID=A0ABT8EJ38_9BURK|nr:acryloyl-CoA reductase [Alcaligenes endophyticus]MCX5591613.1 acryloyl-CoA reductase [Alcaligenes endophyticus]MDN4121290.1 acryloyl-CoA reductase [Alcaligenes endophyticus]